MQAAREKGRGGADCTPEERCMCARLLFDGSCFLHVLSFDGLVSSALAVIDLGLTGHISEGLTPRLHTQRSAVRCARLARKHYR